MAELAQGTTLLTWQGVKTLAGSNPALSAMTILSFLAERRKFVKVTANIHLKPRKGASLGDVEH